MRNTIVYLIGHYGVGKLTIARAICAVTTAVLFDNHRVNNVIFPLIQADGKSKLPPRVWELTWVIREQAMLAIEEIAPSDTSYVLTNCLTEHNPMDRKAFDQVATLAQRRGNTFVPVLLRASDAAHAARIGSADRVANFKHTDLASAQHMRQTTELLRFEHPNRLDIDTTDLAPADAARLIIEHAERLA